MQEFPIRETWKHINAINWREPGFDIQKAYVCALFSELTYYQIPDFELKDADRVNVIPCHAYQEAVRGGRTVDFDQFMRSLDFGQFFTVIRRYAIVVGVRTPNVIVIAIRGTKYLYDWLVNLRATQLAHESGTRTVHFHSGFFRALSACLEAVSLELLKFFRASPEQMPIFVTGHSLGGAMAAIMHAIWGMTVSGEFVHDGIVANRLRTNACYTFGMPRYGDMKAVVAYREPYHLYNELDIVPTVPPRWLGFESCLSEFMLDGTSMENTHARESLKFFSWVSRLLSGKGIANHSMELYRERISLKL
ncbi:hypothetical protein ACCT24_34975 [Rhizobium ruizarguesonis]|nr:hypothetical protein [Rhizobium leguminosarum]